jgi:pyruvate formate lyase activating enzyme
MKIVGLQKLTLLDFPGQVACTVFLGGCNFRCPFCHNSQLLDGNVEEVMSADNLMTFLNGRKGILDGVCVTGGEPTLQPQLPQLLRCIKEMGFRVKLDTNGYRPEVLRSVVQEGLVDYVAMDVKNGPQAYAATVGLAEIELDKIEDSIRFLLTDSVDYELRTTVAQPLHTEQSMTDLCNWLTKIAGENLVKRFFLQPFVDRETVPVAGLSAPSELMLAKFAELLRLCSEKVEVRGI